ncbi:sensor histidine kinase [Paenibacillus antri]|uniref:Sensor histidine kinase n=1 Tax=Paenibacillus antri TaxID=2582848 RepID=A0A5R9G8H2_9BACL|nr:sensor histidine kinase [Paenibacillus antri]TLS49043.1 sensor histidine kinase [Paenibacillus antri]
MGRVKLTFDNVRLRNKMLVVYILSVFVPIVFTNIVFYHVTIDNVREQRMQDISRAIEQIRQEFRVEIEDTVSISGVFYTDLLLNEILEADYASPIEYIEAYDYYLRRVLNSYAPVYHSVQAITVYVDNPTMLHSGGIGYISEDVRNAEWYRVVAEAKYSAPVFMRTETGGVKDTFSIVRKMDFVDGQNEREKILKIDLRTSALRQIFSNLNLQGNMYLVNENGAIEFTTDPTIDWMREERNFSELTLPEGTLTLESGTENEYAAYLNGWRIVGTISEDEVLKEVRKSREFIILLASINMVIPTLIIVWFTKSLSDRLAQILKHMKKVKNQQYDTIDRADSRDEIGQLTSEFNRMTLQVKSLIQDVYLADLQKKEHELQTRYAQLNALQSQINPHFLFNSLETIRMRSLIKQETETAKIIQNMAKIFRNSLAWRKDTVTIREEMEFINCFLEIQKYRFGDKLDYRLQVDESAYDCQVPKMAFLPFVENASIHGVEPLKGNGRIELEIGRTADALLFTLRDNGVGMDEEKIRRLHGYLESEEEMGDRIGVQNVIYRLKLYYGDRFRLRFESEPGRGTIVRIELPLQGDAPPST